MEKFFKIGEISKLYQIGVDSLRYYEEIGIIHPKRSESGYRLYSIQDIWRLNVIRELRELNFSMDRIRKYLDCHNVDSTLELLTEEQEAIARKQEMLSRLQKNVVHRMQTIRTAQGRCLDTITVEERPLRRCFATTQGYSDQHEMDVLIQRLLNIDKERFYVIGNNQIGSLLSLENAQRDGNLRYTSVFLIDENGPEIIPGGTYLTACYVGSYSQSRIWAQKLLNYAEKHRLRPAGDILELLWIDIHTSSQVEEQLTELQLRVEPME